MRSTACVAIIALLAGCAGAPAPAPSSSPSETSPAVAGDTACPPAHKSGALEWAAPRWRAGDYWNYTVWRGDEVEGWENQTVLAIGPVGQASACAFHVEVRSSSRYASDAAHPDGGAMNTRTETYDARTLHRVWDGRPSCVAMEDCHGDVPWPYDFPLRDGKAWAYTAGGDVSLPVEAAVALRGSGDGLRLNVIHAHGIGSGETYRYSPQVGNAVAWERTEGGDVQERKALDAYRFQAAAESAA